MKPLPLVALAALLLAACARPAEEPELAPGQEPFAETVTYGEAVDPVGPALEPADLTADPNTYNGQPVRVRGTVAQVCQRTGCWLELQNTAGPNVRVEVPRDETGQYLWTFPPDLGPVRALVEGIARVREVSAEDRRHLAEDAGLETDVAGFTEPGQEIVVEARGVLVERTAETATPTPQG